MSGTPHSANDVDPLTTGGVLAEAVRRWPQSDALIIGDTRLSYRELLDRTLVYARGLVGLGVKAGDHVGILMPNSDDYILLFHALGLIGATTLTINARYREDDLSYIVPASDMSLLFIGGQALPHADYRTLMTNVYPALAAWNGRGNPDLAAAPRLRGVFNFADPRETIWPTCDALIEAAAAVPEAAVWGRARAVKGSDICLMMFSSGTTARPKACMLSHESLCRTGAALAKRFRMTETDRIFDPLPFFHMSTMLPLAACRAAGSALIARLHFETGASLEEMERERATISYASFPTMMSAFLAHPDFHKRDLSSLRLVHAVGPSDLLRRYHAAFPQAYLVNAYGLTEASGVACYSDLHDPQDVSIETNGRPFDGCAAKVVDPETLEDVPPGRSGEIWMRGFCIFAGYYKDPEGTARVKRPDGWLRTGDIGALDEDGRVIYRGRLKDMIKIGGENVAAIEIENYLCTHPDILIAQVIGVPDDHLLEVAAAFVEVKDGAEITAEDVVRYCSGRIASFKIPRYVRFVRDWPMSATKIQKFKLLESFVPEGKIDVRALAGKAKA